MAQIDPSEVEELEVSPDGYAIGLDLVRLESTRFGLELVGTGYALSTVFATLAVFASDVFFQTFTLLGALSGLLLAIGHQQTSPTPNGFLPGWLRGPFVLILWLSAVHGVLQVFARDLFQEHVIPWSETLHLTLLTQLVFVGLPWILWRFSQHRGLIGRAITWLWIALLSTGCFALSTLTEVFWVVALEPAVGVLFAVTAHYTARDVWLDAVNRKTKKLAVARAAAAAASN